MKTALLFLIAVESSRVIEPVYWKVDNKKFATQYERHVQLQTKMDIFCPQYSSPAEDEDPRTFSESHHFQTIYMVDEDSYNLCRLNAAKAKKIMSCEQPLRVKKFTMKFQEVNPNPFGLEFHADSNYYFISTSMGDDLGGISQMNEGVCKSHSMKLKILVHRGAYEDEEKPEDLPDDPAKEKHSELPNAIIVGVIVGTFLVILIIVAILLTRRVFENRKSSDVAPTSHPVATEKRLTDDFSYIDGSRLSNRTHEIVMV